MIIALSALGRRDEAIALYRTTRSHIVDELGLDPSPVLTTAFQQALTGTTPPPAAMRSLVSGLPRPPSHFTGRATELNTVVAALSDAHRPRLCVIHGMAGSGKTSLAVYAAQHLTDAFSDGCLFVDLHGYTPHTPPVPADEALERLLRRLGVPGTHIPSHLDDRISLYRDQLAHRRLLLILDNAHDATQIQPLLPTGSETGALITSRRRLAALDDADTLALDTLTVHDAAALFRSAAGTARLAREPSPLIARQAALSHIVATCGHLPLAIRIAAARYRIDHTLTLPALADALSRPTGPLGYLDDGDRSLPAALETSLIDLPAATRHHLLLLSLHPGDPIDAHAAHAVTADPDTTRHLTALVDRHLLDQPDAGLYQFHDLIHTLARNHAQQELTAAQRKASVGRIVDYYLAAATRADLLLAPDRYRPALQLTYPPADLPPLVNYQQALTWMTDNDATLVATCRAAAAERLDSACWQLAFAAREYYFISHRLQPWHTTHHLALAAARRLGDQRAEAMTLHNLGMAALQAGNLDIADNHYQAATSLFQELGDAHGEHTALASHAWIAYQRGRYTEFLADMRTARAFYQRVGATRNAAITLRSMGLAETALGDTGRAITHLNDALAVFLDLDSPIDAAMSLNALGEAHASAGQPREAIAAHQKALSHADHSGSTSERARAHHRLGDLAAADHNARQARWHWSAALTDYLSLADPRASQLRTQLAQLDR